MALLLGEHDAHLAVIEHRLGVSITPRGNRITIKGDKHQAEFTRAVLLHLYTKAARGGDINRGEIDGAIRMVKLAESAEHGGHGQDGGVRTRRKTINARTPNQQNYIEQIRKNELVFGVGPAGTGKTYLAVACAAEALMNGEVDRVILSRPAVEAGERLGFLPGDMKEKVDPYLRPLYDALYDMMPQSLVQKALAENQIEIAPLAFMRGRTLSSAFIILDEAQNTTPQQMKMFLTRLGEGSRMVVTGDPTQIDLPSGIGSGLVEATSILDGVKGIGITQFINSDIVRHPLVGRIVQAYDKRQAKAPPRNR
ncbi:PhoH family protein [Aestuariivirga litoralis]|uniref:PhoH family protein n=1 Tax=Aestuariivirga litoralis TaxID=2650924 RepID=UPI0018C81AC7|nr:PhoH family protein [Aestuariivirga litoralis]MBG1233817.1 PhoH family protein [Aestuariivirga litoralis]